MIYWSCDIFKQHGTLEDLLWHEYMSRIDKRTIDYVNLHAFKHSIMKIDNSIINKYLTLLSFTQVS